MHSLCFAVILAAAAAASGQPTTACAVSSINIYLGGLGQPVMHMHVATTI
jgi:hypothetical protein